MGSPTLLVDKELALELLIKCTKASLVKASKVWVGSMYWTAH